MALDEWYDFLGQESWVAAPLYTQHHRLEGAVRHVFAKAIFAGIVDTYDDHRGYCGFADQAFRSLVHLPFHTIKGGRGLEKILPIVEVKDGIAARSIFEVIVAGRQPDPQKTAVPKDLTVELVNA